MSIFKCKMCGGALKIQPGQTVVDCDYCGTQQTLPKLDDDRRANLYDRANHFRRNNEFDKAMNIYEQILDEDNTDAESYWSLVLCRYGVEYVEDPTTHKRVPTVNRAQFTSVFDDNNYKSALQYADTNQRGIYESEAQAINEIQKGFLAISQQEAPFDVFICYKESDNFGRRTPDSVLANDLYHQLTQEGFNVFFARITLEDKLGSAYEPYIFAALNSAKVMVVLGTKPEYFNAVWVKNEWSRYLALIKQGQKKMLIPAYKDMDPYDLPEEFSHLQAQDMSKLGFMQDLIRGIKKITQANTPQAAVVQEATISNGSANTAPLLKRAFMFLEDGDWKSAKEYCEKVLDIEPECPDAYLGRLLAELNVHRKTDLGLYHCPFDHNDNYNKIKRFGSDMLVSELEEYNNIIRKKIENQRRNKIYADALNAMKENDIAMVESAIKNFESIITWKDSKDKIEDCRKRIALLEIQRKDAIYYDALNAMKENNIAVIESAIEKFESIITWKDSKDKIADCHKQIGIIKEHKKRAQIVAQVEAIKRKKRNTVILISLISLVIGIFAFLPAYHNMIKNDLVGKRFYIYEDHAAMVCQGWKFPKRLSFYDDGVLVEDIAYSVDAGAEYTKKNPDIRKSKKYSYTVSGWYSNIIITIDDCEYELTMTNGEYSLGKYSVCETW